MDVYEATITRRSIRRFKQEKISPELLEKLVNAARLAPSAANLQPLHYIIIDDEKIKDEVFYCLRWAAYIAPRGTPPPDKKPQAYIVVLYDKRNILEEYIGHDIGAACENILLVAHSFGLGSCWLCSIDKNRLRQILSVPDEFEIDSVIALGYPDQISIIEEFKDSIKYWLDENNNLHVPKRNLRDITHRNKF